MQGIVGLRTAQYYQLKALVHTIIRYSQPRKLTNDELLILCLIYMRQYVSQLFLSWIFNVSESTISRCIESIHNILYEKLSCKIFLPPREQRNSNMVLFDGNIISMIIDGAEQEVYKPMEKNVEQSVYSGKKCYHTFTKLIGVSPNGIIYAISPSYHGSVADITMALMDENRWFKMLDSDECIMADKGFRGLETYHKTIIPFVGKQLPFAKELFNQQIASIRIVVENAIRAVKEWKICGLCLRTNMGDWESALEYHNRNWVVCSAMSNIFRRVRVAEANS